jgi:SAM-dependent MidA family methyltransferase
MSLSEIITERIRKDGPISFRDFMEMALYYPGAGYYTSAGDKIGKHGDFYTSPYFTSIFGEMLGRQLEEMWQVLGKKEFTVVEYGAGTGSLCRDILNQLKNNEELYDKLHYCIIEKSPVMREKEKTILREKVSWYDTIQDIPAITGCILSNEVVDNFSVHQVVMEEELMEVFVGYDNGFVELLKPASKELKDYLAQLNVRLPNGFRTEINLQAIDWIKEIAAALKKGFVLTIDYGYPSSELYSGDRSSGTLVCFNKHHTNYLPYSNIGEQDITAHVNFSALCHWGFQNGLESCGFTDQAHFLRALGLVNHLKEMEERGKFNQASDQEKAFLIQTFLMDMGSKFKVLIQHKGVQRPMLSGLMFSQQLV